MVKHAAASMNRYNVGSDGLTAHRSARGRPFNKEVVDFGASVWYLKPRTKGKMKLRSRWASGIWLGIREESGEVIIGTSEGVIKVRTVRRKGSHVERWCAVQLDAMQGTPWEPQPGVDSVEIFSKIKVLSEKDAAELPRLPEGVKDIDRKHRFPIRKGDVEKPVLSVNILNTLW
jgi:hypothetical protein